MSWFGSAADPDGTGGIWQELRVKQNGRPSHCVVFAGGGWECNCGGRTLDDRSARMHYESGGAVPMRNE